MAKIVLGKTKDDLDREEAKKQREKEAEIQNYISERQMKLEALHRQQTKNKIILIAVVSVIATGLTFFGVYNTFFKKGLTMENDVNPAINGAISGLSFPSEGLDNYIRDNCESMFNKYFNINNNQVDHVYVDKNSCNIRKVNAYSATMAQVWFSVDVTTVEKDYEITDTDILNQIKSANILNETASYEDNANKFEFASNEVSLDNALQLTAVTKKDPSVDDSSVDDDSKVKSKETKSKEVESKKEDSSTDSSFEEPVVDSMPDDTSYDNDEDIDITSSDTTDSDTMSSDGESSTTTNKTNVIRDNNGNIIEYYFKDNTYYRVGDSITNRYNFVVGIEFFYEYDGDTPVTSGFRPVTDLILYTLNDVDQTNFDDEELTVSPFYEFNEDTKLDSNETEKIRVKIDKTLQDLYEMRDVSQDFMNYRTFNTYNAKYVSLDKIDSYSEDNYLGYNTYIEYTILTSQGFTYQIKTYLKVEPSGNSYVITKIL